MRHYLLTCEIFLDDLPLIDQLAARIDSLRPSAEVMVRIPIQWDSSTHAMATPTDYIPIFERLSKHAKLMIEFADSAAMAQLTPSMYQQHVRKCLGVLGRFCTVGEAGNEINAGNWQNAALPYPHAADEVVKMVQLALNECAGHIQTAITYYLAPNTDPFLLAWMQQYAANLKSDFALISHYPNTGSFPDERMKEIWRDFSGLANATMIGWGEYGTELQDGQNPASPAERAALIRNVEGHYWSLLAPLNPRYVGMGGYWDWKTDTFLDTIFKEVWTKP